MAEPNSPAGESAAGGRRAADESAPTTPAEPELLAPPTEEELDATGEPTLEEIHAAAAGDAEVGRADEPATRTDAAEPAEPATRAVAAEPAEPARPEPSRGSAAPAAESVAAAQVVQEPAPAAPVEPQPVLAPAEDSAPPPPRRHSNRLVGTAWVLLAAGLFEALYFGAIALLALVLAGPTSVAPQIRSIATAESGVFAWLPVLLFALLYELTVLLFNRAGRFAYVVASLVVAVIVYAACGILIPLMITGTQPDSNTAAQTFLNPVFLLILIVAREVMLWTGFAIGSRGTRVRRRNRAERSRYDEELADA